MKKITAIILTFGILATALPVLATTVSFSPAAIEVVKGHSATVSIVMNPAGVANYSEKVEIKYPANLVSVTGFTQASPWIALPQPVYDLIDNVNGLLIKTAGYPGGLTVPAAFGSVTFSALKAGSGTITVGDQSLAFEASKQNAIGGPALSLNVSAPAPVVAAPVTAKPETAATATLATTSQNASETAAAGQGLPARDWVIILSTLLVLETLGFIGYIVFGGRGEE